MTERGGEMGVLDQTLRLICHADPPAVPERLMASAGFAAKFIDWHDTRSVALPGSADRTADLVARLEGPSGEPWLLVIEFQERYESGKLDSTFEQVARMRAHLRVSGGSDRFRAAAAIVYLRGRGRREVIDMTLPNGNGTRFEPVVWNWEDVETAVELDRIARGELPWSALYWTPATADAEDPTLIRRWLELVNRVPEERRTELRMAAAILASYVGRSPLWESEMQGLEYPDLRIVSDLQESARRMQARKSVLTLLMARFPDDVNDDLKLALKAPLALEVLDDWIVAAGTVPSFSAFLAHMRG